MYKEVQRALRSFFVRSSTAAAQQPQQQPPHHQQQQQQAEWQLQQQPLGLRSAVRDADLPPALADGSFGGGGGNDGSTAGSITGSLAVAEPDAQVCSTIACTIRSSRYATLCRQVSLYIRT